jgi:hypothetical protein
MKHGGRSRTSNQRNHGGKKKEQQVKISTNKHHTTFKVQSDSFDIKFELQATYKRGMQNCLIRMRLCACVSVCDSERERAQEREKGSLINEMLRPLINMHGRPYISICFLVFGDNVY